MRTLIATLALFVVAGPAVVSAGPGSFRIDPSRPMADYAIASWRDTSGLPVDSVASLAQTPDGYIWLGTEQGLVRFDGVRFTVFTRRNVSALPSNDISALFVSKDGTLWVGTRGHGAVTWDGTQFRRVPIPYKFIVGFAESHDGAVWIGAPSAITRAYRGNYTTFGKNEGYPGGRLYAVAADSDGAYAALPQGVFRISERGARHWSEKDGLGGATVRALLMSSGGLLAADESGHVFRLEQDRFVRLFTLPGEHAVASVLEGPERSLWLATIGGGIVRYAGGRLDSLTQEDGLTSDSINPMIEDDEGNLWAGTTGGGLVRISEGRLRTVETPQKLNGEWILPLTQASDGSVWFATNGGGLNHLTADSVTRLTTEDGLGSNAIMAIAEDSEGSIWVGHAEGLQRVVNGTVQPPLTATGLAGKTVWALAVAQDGTLWVSGSGGVHTIAGGVVRDMTRENGVPAAPIVAIREAADGSRWFVRPDSVEHFSSGKLTSYGREEGLISKNVWALTIDEVDGSVWVGTSGDGIARIREGRVTMYDSTDGLLGDTAYAIVQDRRGDVWISTSFGLYTVSRASFDRFDRGEISRIPITVFRKSDGLKSSDFSGGFDRAGFRAADGTLWFPTTRGLAVVDPQALPVNTTPPRVRIESIVENGIDHGTSAVIRAPRGRRTFEIAYTAPVFIAAEGMTFRYKLLGFDDEWQDAGTRRTAYYTNVPPGEYRFVVRATTADGISADAEAPVEVLPRFHEAWPFRLACALVLLLFVLIVFRRRMEKIRRHERDLRKSEEHFRSLIENAPDMLIIVDRLGRIAYASPSVTTALGPMPEVEPGREMRGLFVEPRVCDTFLGEVRKRSLHSLTHAFRDAEGSPREIEIVGATAAHSDELVLNCRDITDRRKLESKLEQANRLTSLGRLAATISHEFNNVLMGIQPFVEIIRRKSDDSGVHNATVRIGQSVARGKRISEEILRFTRPVEPTLTSTPVRSWLLDLETEIRALVGPGVQMAIIAPEGVAISADPGQLNQVLTNLAINARDAGATSVRIEACRIEGDGHFEFGVVENPERFAHITFSDNGSGIPESVLPHVFEPLFTTKKTKGTGLGLAVAHQVISRHGGELFVESRVGTGTTFHMFLPYAVSETGELLSGGDELPVADAPASCRVLLVEDDATVADGVMLVLESDGFHVAHAANGGDALSMIPRFAPDVVILDVGLPDIDGIELYHRIAKQWPRLRVIFSTGHGDVARLDFSGAVTPLYLQKPYTVEELVGAIGSALEQDVQAHRGVTVSRT